MFGLQNSKPRRLYVGLGNDCLNNIDPIGLLILWGKAPKWWKDGWKDVIDGIKRRWGDRDGFGSAGPGSPEEKCCISMAVGLDNVGKAAGIHSGATKVGHTYKATLARAFPSRTSERIGNALRHCVAACALAVEFGSEKAWEVLECHEPDIPVGDRTGDDASDAHNNSTGIRIGESLDSTGDCVSGCAFEMLSGGLNLD